jgi:hypothetical protein
MKVTLLVFSCTVLIFMAGCRSSRSWPNGDQVISSNDRLANEYFKMSGDSVSTRVFFQCYQSHGQSGVYAVHRLGSHWCYERFIVLRNDSLYDLGVRSDSAQFNARLKLAGYSDKMRVKALKKITGVLHWPCGEPQF